MAREFRVGDKITTGYSTTNATRSIGLWVYSNGNDLDNGRMFEKRVAGAQVEVFAKANGIATYRYEITWSGGNGRWDITRPSQDAWHHLLVTYDQGSTSNDPVIYLDGSSVTVTEASAPLTTLTTNTDAYVIGNRATDDLRYWEGYLAEFAIWNRILTAAEAAILGRAYSPLFIPNGLVSYCPLIRDMVDIKNGTITDDATSEIAHPRIIYPYGDPTGIKLPTPKEIKKYDR